MRSVCRWMNSSRTFSASDARRCLSADCRRSNLARSAILRSGHTMRVSIGEPSAILVFGSLDPAREDPPVSERLQTPSARARKPFGRPGTDPAAARCAQPSSNRNHGVSTAHAGRAGTARHPHLPSPECRHATRLTRETVRRCRCERCRRRSIAAPRDLSAATPE